MSDGKLIGAVRADRDVDGLVLTETEYDAGLSIASHPHPEPMCCLVLEGAMTERWGRSEVRCEAGTLTYLPPDEPHGQEYHVDGSRCFLVRLGPSWVRRMRDLDLDPRAGPFPLEGAKANWLAAQLYREFRSPDASGALATEGFALAMLGELARAVARRERDPHPPWLVRAAEILHDRMSEPVRMAEIAAEVDVHPTHLARTFRERFDCTMGEYLRRIRIEVARTRLECTDDPLSAIAFDAGFADQAHFTRTFKRLTGETPGAWRRARPSR